MQIEEINGLIARWKAGKIDDKERVFLESWLDNYPESPKAVADNKNNAYQVEDLSSDFISVWSQLERRRKFNRVIYRILPSTAAAVLVFAIMGWWVFRANSLDYLDPMTIEAAANIAPSITLPSGKTVSLDTSMNGIIMGDKILYTDGKTVAGLTHSPTDNITLSIPSGITFNLTLSDGTKVWLNAGSSLTYPAHFTGTSREVELEGEAYFDVKKQSTIANNKEEQVKFIVTTDEQRVEVLGTDFNVRAYRGGVERTTLLGGKIRLATLGSSQVTTISPGEEATIKDERLTINKVDGTYAIAWVNSLFNFDNKSFYEIMEEVSRWYDLEIVYENGIPNETFFGNAYRSADLSTILDLLESAKIEYLVNNNRQLIIKQKVK